LAQIFVMGAGGFGTALAVMAHHLGHHLTIWSPFQQEVEQLNTTREHQKLLRGVTIPKEIVITTSLKDIPKQDLVILATPSSAVRQTAQRLASRIDPKTTVVCVSKGLEAGSYKPLSDVLEEELSRNRQVMLSGPSHAEEVARGVPTAVVAACRNRAAAEYVQDTLGGGNLRIYVSDDVLGVELGGALKNVIALAAGILDGLQEGDNTKAALMTRGIAEIARLGVALGAKSETFSGLSGIGDLIVTCASMHSRNRRCGILIGQGMEPAKAVEEIGMTVEGYGCAKIAWELSQKHSIAMPIVEQVYAVLYQGKNPKEAVSDLMKRPNRHESEAIWLLSR
jgi:glycerol-3-phosphate dehydrogenase (NAD(P)+)